MVLTMFQNFNLFEISAVNSSDEVRSRREATCMKKYGVAHPLQNEDVKRRAYNTWMEHYGVPYPTMSDQIKKKDVGHLKFRRQYE